MKTSQAPRLGVVVTGAGAAFVGGFWLIAWLCGSAARWSAAGTTITMKTNTALGLVLAGAALILLGIRPRSPASRRVGIAAAALVVLLGGLTLSEHVIGWNLGIDQLLASEPPGAMATRSPNRMGVPASTSYVLLGVALLLLGSGRRKFPPYLGLAVVLIDVVPAVGFLYGVDVFFSAGATGIAWPTVMAMIGLGLGLVLACPERGPMALLLRDDAGGKLLRGLLPIAIFLPLGLGFLRVLGQRGGLYDTPMGTGLFALAMMVIFSAMLWRNAAQLSSASRRQKQTEEALQQNRERLDLALASSRMATFDWDIVNDRRTWSDGVHGLLGTRPNTFTGTAEEFFRIVHPDDRSAVKTALAKAVDETGVYETEYRAVWPDESIHHIAARGTVHRDSAGRAVSLTGVCWDITDRKRAEAEHTAAVHESERQFRALADSIPNLAWWANADGYITWYNRRWYDYTGTKPKDMEGWGWQSVHDPEVLPKVLERWKASIATGEAFDMVFPLRGADGRFRPFLTRVQPLKDARGQVTQWFGTNTDVSELKRAEEAQALLAAIVESSNDAIISKGLDGTILTWNAGAQRLLGYHAEEIIGKPITVLLPPELVHEEAHFLERLRRGERVEHTETVRVAKDGRRIDVSVAVSPLKDPDGHVVGASKIVRDISERKRAEKALRDSEERYRQLFGSLLEGFCIIEVLFDTQSRPIDYRFLEINPAFEAQTGLHDAQGKRMRELAPEHEAHWFEIYGKVALTGEPTRFLNEAKALNRWFDVSAYRVGGPESRKVAILFADITERVRAEQGLKQTADELARSNQDLEQFAYVASHDLQEPLRMVTGYLQLLDRRYTDKLDQDAREFIGFAVDGATRMSRLITDLLDYSRVNTRGRSPEPVAMESVLQRAVENLHTAIRDSGVQILHDPLPTVRGDATQLAQLLQNLVGNAIKFRSADRPIQIYIGAKRTDDEWVFSVRDNGIGIEPQYAERIFLIFQRLHSRGEYPGTGIGLAICRRIVERHGGRIWVESQPGAGSTFFFTIRISGASR